MKRKMVLLLGLLLLGVEAITAQTRNVTGIVISEEDNQPVIGASVLVQGSSKGTITNVDGQFNLAVAEAEGHEAL